MFTIVYDNYPHNPELTPAWGFACLVEGLEKTILLDTGGDGKVLLSNMAKLNIDPKSIDILVLSHSHGDHTGGLGAFLRENSALKVFLLESFPRGLKSDVRKTGAEVVEVKDFCEIVKGAYSTGEMGRFIKEEALAIETSKGMVVLTGCAHPGVVKMVEKAKKETNSNIHLVMGGFHLGGLRRGQLEGIVQDFKRLGVEKAAPTHCSGDLTREVFAEGYGDNFILLGVGKKVEIKP